MEQLSKALQGFETLEGLVVSAMSWNHSIHLLTKIPARPEAG